MASNWGAAWSPYQAAAQPAPAQAAFPAWNFPSNFPPMAPPPNFQPYSASSGNYFNAVSAAPPAFYSQPQSSQFNVQAQRIPTPTTNPFLASHQAVDTFRLNHPHQAKHLESVPKLAEESLSALGDVEGGGKALAKTAHKAANFDPFVDIFPIRFLGGYANEMGEASLDVLSQIFKGQSAAKIFPKALLGAGHTYASALKPLKGMAPLVLGDGHAKHYLDIVGKQGKDILKNMGAAEATVMGAYGLTAGYVLGDTAYTFGSSFKNSDRKSTVGKLAQATAKAGHTALFQTFASLVIPAQIIAFLRKNVTTRLATNVLGKAAGRTLLGASLGTWGGAALALAAMPVIAKVVDYGVEKALHYTYKPLVEGTVNRVFAPKEGVKSDSRLSEIFV